MPISNISNISNICNKAIINIDILQIKYIIATWPFCFIRAFGKFIFYFLTILWQVIFFYFQSSQYILQTTKQQSFITWAFIFSFLSYFYFFYFSSLIRFFCELLYNLQNTQEHMQQEYRIKTGFTAYPITNQKQASFSFTQDGKDNFRFSNLQNDDQLQLNNKVQQPTQNKKDAKLSHTHRIDQHKISLEELCNRLGTSLEFGLTTDQAQKRNVEEGDNKLPEKKKQPKWLKFLKQVTNWFSIMLWVGSILCIVIYLIQPQGNTPNLYLSFVLMFVVLLTGAITYAQGQKSQAMMEGFKNMLPSTSKVLRNGKITQIPAEKLVRGDIIEINMGEKIPADIRILSCVEMKVNNSSLTGEVQPLQRSNNCTNPGDHFETKNLAFFGTLCQQGRGRGIVIAIAEKTVMGQIADLAASGGTQKSPLRIELDRFVLLITIIALSLGVIFFFLAFYVIGYNVLQCIIFGIGIIVSNVPEGLLACITISLAITAEKLAEKKVLVKNLQAVQTLGSTSCICSDKTGTLTQNKMTVEYLWYDQKVIKGENKEIKGTNFNYEYNAYDQSFKILHHTALICSSAIFDVDQQTKSNQNFKYINAHVIGDASQTALIKFYQPIQDIGKTRSLYRVANGKDSQAKMPFNSTNKYSLTIVEQEGTDHHYVCYIKGAPEKIWKYCNRILYEGKFNLISNNQQYSFQQVNQRFGKNGERVLGFAMLPLKKQSFYKGYPFITTSPNNFNFPMQNFIFVGLISLMDPPKQTVPFAIKKCHSAGIKVIMITGDQPATAAAIAKKIGIIKSKTNKDLILQGFSPQQAFQKANAIVIHGDLIKKAYQEGDEQGQIRLKQWVKKPEVVFARTTPDQKLLIVKVCQSIGNVVGVTGDGVNDSPAIKQADIGISMGISGSDVTKEVADMVLLNDDFSSIVDGIEEGRKIFDNLKKTIVYLLTSNMTQIWPFIAFVIIQIPLPLSNIFMLCICVGTDIYPALSLAYQEAEVDIMTRRPRKPDQHLVSTRLLAHAYGIMGEIATCGGFFSYYIVMRLYGFTPTIIHGLVSRAAIIPMVQNKQGLLEENIFFNSDQCQFNQYAPNLGCSAFAIPCQDSYIRNIGFPNWLSTVNNKLDLRGVYSTCVQGKYIPVFDFPLDVLDTYSKISGAKVAYTTESIFFAQSSYFVTIVLVQWSNIFACKSRKVSLIYSGFNKHMMAGVAVQTFLSLFLLYVPVVNQIFGGRPLNFFILGIPGLGFSMFLLCWQESRKYLINRNSNNGQANWWQKNLLW